MIHEGTDLVSWDRWVGRPGVGDRWEAQAMEPTVTVVGTAGVAVDPDRARLSCGVQLTGVNAQDALGRLNEAMHGIVEVVTGAGIDRRDIRTAGPSAFPVEQGYLGSSDLSVLVRDIAAVGGLIDAIAASSGPDLTLRGVTFSVLEPDAHLSGPRAAISEGAGHQPPGPVGRMVMATAATPIEPGTQQLRVDVTVTYRLLDAT
jgi:uncharacterized protein YggE